MKEQDFDTTIVFLNKKSAANILCLSVNRFSQQYFPYIFWIFKKDVILRISRESYVCFLFLNVNANCQQSVLLS